MKRLKSPRINKLSTNMPEASRTDARKNLEALNQLIAEGDAVAEEIDQLIQKLSTPCSTEQLETLSISSSLSYNQLVLKHLFANSMDIIFREFAVGEEQTPALIIYVDGLVDTNIVNKHIMQPLMKIQYSSKATSSPDSPIKLIEKVFLEASEVEEIETIGEITAAVLEGDTALLIDGAVKALSIETKGWEARSVSEPITEGVVRGPREAFTEDVRVNTALLRRRIKSTQFRLEQFILGRMTQTKIILAYLEGTTDDKVLEEVRRRIERIEVDSILESAYIEELIEDTPYTVFPQIEHSERPDKVAAAVLEGRVAILVDGTPFVLMVPTIVTQFLQSSEDYYERYPVALLVRVVRVVFSTIALLLPGFYVAITNFHQELIPTALLISIEVSRVGVPFPIYIEALLMEITFEALREAGVRLPQPVGQAISIVGALVIGEAAVEAGIVSPLTVIVVALTGISSFCLPSYNLAFGLRIMRFVFGFLGATLGLYGIMLGMLALLIHIISLRSFGVPYLSPLAPFRLQDLKDMIVRVPWWAMKERPGSIPTNNRQRQKFFLKPRLPANEGQERLYEE